MDTNNSNDIPVESPLTDFGKFLRAKDNKRIFFSGKFGIGKTFFLRKFFEEHIDEYDTHHLYPVRYQISSNESMVELLKYDILVELLRVHPDAFPQKEIHGIKGRFELFAAFCRDRGSTKGFLGSIIETGEGVLGVSPDPLSQTLSRLGRPLRDLLAIDTELQNFKKEYLSGGKEAATRFLAEVQKNVDSVATDYITELLRGKIAELKGERRSVLILDDFDRMDPEHIFRVLNVLSAHMDDNEDNKFGYDHIIIVGDVKNIENIFHHKYGHDVKFDGYFNKYFSVRPFEFDNTKAISERLPHLVKLFKYEDPNLKNAIEDTGIVKHFLEEVLGRASAVGEMSVRQLYKPVNHVFPEMQKGVFSPGPFVDSRNWCIDIGVKLLIAMYMDKINLLRVLDAIRNGKKYSSSKSEWFYDSYASSMLRHLVSLKENEKLVWLGKYHIVASQSTRRSDIVDISLDLGQKASPEYFYDTLIEYIRESKYDKLDNYEYER